MAALSDFDRRDAERTARYEIANQVQRYVIRLVDFVKTDVKEALDEAARTGESVDPVALGRAAAHRAFLSYGFGVGTSEPHPAIDAATDTSDLREPMA